MTSQIGEWVQVETQDGKAEVRADHGSLLLHGFSWTYMTPPQWTAFKATGDALLAGAQGRKAVELATGNGLAGDLADLVASTYPFPQDAPGLEGMTGADWVNVARLIREHPAWRGGLLEAYWVKAGKALSDAE